MARRARGVSRRIRADRPHFLPVHLRDYRVWATVLDTGRSAAWRRDGGALRHHQHLALSQQQSERYHQLRDAAGFGIEPADLDLYLQHSGLRKPGDGKLYVPISRDTKPRPSHAEGAGVFSCVTAVRVGDVASPAISEVACRLQEVRL